LKLRDRKEGRWFIHLSDKFEKKWHDEIEANFDNTEVLLDFLESVLGDDPRSCGEIVEFHGDNEIWAWETPPIGAVPRIYAVYEIIDEDRRVNLLSVTTLDTG
jgi:hypothetical protein